MYTMNNPRPAPLNVIPDNPTGNTWALPDGAIARFGKGFHEKMGSSWIALSPDYSYFTVGTRLGIWWYDIATMTPIALWDTDHGMISAIDISPDGKLIAIANCNGIIKIMDIKSGDLIIQIKRSEDRNIYSHIVFSPDSKRLATAIRSRLVEIIDIQNGECISQMDWGTEKDGSYLILKFGFSQDGEHITATVGMQTYFWNPNTGEIATILEGRNFTFTLDNSLLISENHYVIPNTTPPRGATSISVWDNNTWELVRTLSEEHYITGSKAISPCSQYLTISDFNSTVHVWNLKTGTLQESYDYFSGYVIKLFYLDDETLLSLESTEETYTVWNVKKCEKLQTYEKQDDRIGYHWFLRRPELFIAHTLSQKTTVSEEIYTFETLREPISFPNSVSFSPDGNTLAIKGELNGIGLWDITSKQTQHILIPNEQVDAFNYLPCGDILAIGSDRGFNSSSVNYKVWNINHTGEYLIAEFTTMELGRHTFAITDNRIAVGGKDGTLYLWQPKENTEPRSLIGHTEHILSLAFSSDGTRLFSGSSDNTVRLWDVELGEEIATLPFEKPTQTLALAFSPCNTMIAGGMFEEIRLWCAETLKPLNTIPQTMDGERPYALTFSPCGRYLASGTWWQRGMDKMAIRIWEIETRENITTFWGHNTDIQTLTFSPDGTLLASGGFDGTTLLWDLKSITS